MVVSLLACTPYVDHEVDLFAVRGEIVAFGPKRQLDLVRIEGDGRSLLFVFNQPLRSPRDVDAPVPFQAEIHPPVEIAAAEMEGAAGVRLTFSRPLARSTEYRIELPPGWRTTTGVGLLRPIVRRWRTSQPQVRAVRVAEAGQEAPAAGPLRLSPGQSLELEFNQPVELGSVRAALQWRPLEGEDTGSWTMSPVLDSAGKEDRTRFRLELADPLPSAAYRLLLGPGVKGLEGPLRGDQAKEWVVDFERPLLYTGERSLARAESVALEFSGPVTPQELDRCLLTIPGRARPDLISVDSKRAERLLLRFTGPRPVRLLLTPGLRGQHGRLLQEEVSLELVAATKGSSTPLDSPLVPLSLAPGRHSLAGGSGKTESWPLTLQQALAASLTPEEAWKGRAALAWERGKPVFTASAQLTAKAFPVRDAKVGNAAFLAVRRTPRGGAPSRALVATADLSLQAVSTAEGIRARVRRLSNAQPVKGCALALRDASGAALGKSVISDPKGDALVPWGQGRQGSGPVFLVATWGQTGRRQQTFSPVDPIPPAARPLPAAFSITDRPFYRPEQEMLIGGFLWSAPSPGTNGSARLIVRTEGGKVVLSTPVKIDEQGFFLARCPAPKTLGPYLLTLDTGGPQGPSAASTTPFRVCPVAQEGEAYRLSLEQAGLSYTVTLSREGSRFRKAGLRAKVYPLPRREQELAGWCPVHERQPRWTLLASTTSESSLAFALADPARGGRLEVEAFDVEQPDLVLARTQKELEQTSPSITLELAPGERGPGEQSFRVGVEGLSQGSPALSGVLLLRVPTGWKELKRLTSGEPGEPWDLHLRTPGRYRLLIRASLPDGSLLEGVWEREVEAGELPSVGLAVEPQVATPGASLTATLSAVEIGSEVWLQATGGGVREGRFETVAANGVLAPWTLGFARALAVELSAQSRPLPGWGRQRVGARTWRVPVPLSPPSRVGQMTLAVEREDGREGQPRDDENLRVSLQREGPGESWNALLMCNQVQPGWDPSAPPLLESFLGWSPPPLVSTDYPLLPESSPSNQARKVLNLAAEAAVTLPAPDHGAYLWTAIARDKLGRFAWTQTNADVGEASRWGSAVPWGARAGDRFQAGLKFVSAASESAPLGLTAHALLENGFLSPTGYLHTAGVAKPGTSYRLLFDYQLSDSAKSPVKMGWDLGHGGKVHRQEAELEVFEVPAVPRGGGVAAIAPSARSRIGVPGPLPWRLVLRPPEADSSSASPTRTVLEVRGPQGSLGRVHLTSDKPPVVLQGAGPGTVEVEHVAGDSSTYEMFRLEPDPGDLTSWGERLFLFRYLLDEDGTPTDSAILGAPCRIRICLVNPAPLKVADVHLPLPGGLRPTALWPRTESTPNPNWRSQSGELRFQLTGLPAGEFHWELEVSPEAAGDYLWPAAQAIGEYGELLALSGSSRVPVLGR